VLRDLTGFLFLSGTYLEMKNAVFWDVLRVVHVRTDISEEHIASILRVTRSGEEQC
jgi:hypothetical protein